MARRSTRKKLAVIDSETDPFSHGSEIKPFAWGYYDGETAKTWWEDEDAFVEFLLEQNAVVYAHNGGRFDFPFLYKYLEPGDAISLINGVPVKIQFGRAELRDSLRILPVPLSAISKQRFEYWKMLRGTRDEYRAEILDYLVDDCVKLFESVQAFEAEFGRNLTVAGAAMKAYQRIEENTIEDQGAGQYELLKPFYFGGRCELAPGKIGVFRHGLKGWDVNSAYPWACTFDHPCGPPTRYAHLPKDGTPYFARIDAVSDGCLPWRENPGDRIEYPRDGIKRTYHASSHEIEAGLETGTLEIKRVRDTYLFPDRWHARNYVDVFFRRKADAKAALKAAKTEGERMRATLDLTFSKLMLNGLYGKTGQDASRFRDFELIPIGQVEKAIRRGHTVAGVIGDLCVIAKPARQSRWYDVAIAASVTAMVRAKLWRAICASEDFYYCDTDSIFAQNAVLSVGDSLGDWSFEGAFDGGAFAGRKLYALHHADHELGACYACGHREAHHDEGIGCARCECRSFHYGYKTASKGTRLGADEIYRVARGEPVTWRSEAPTQSVARGFLYQTRTVRREEPR